VAIAISHTSKRPSRAMGAKARLMGDTSAKSKRSRVDRTWPDLSACVFLYVPTAARRTGTSVATDAMVSPPATAQPSASAKGR